ncbi:MAG: outer membrane beta-barrel protein, partial [Candidatus Omnitrophica bacterium]|nr:outer membrane beta-barrel protein [Candidatus Omnitrophota bacterium]
PGFAFEEWFEIKGEVTQKYDDNIYLSKNSEREDWILVYKPEILFKPPLTHHKFTTDYSWIQEIFYKYDNANNYNHTSNQNLQLDLNRLTINIDNKLSWFSSRAGSEDTTRTPRAQDHAKFKATYDLNKIDISTIYTYKREDYRSDAAIGAPGGHAAASYQDMDSHEHRGELEAALKIWTKTSLLLSSAYGEIHHDTNIKSDSDYIDGLIGLRGKLTAKGTIEMKIGYRHHEYEKYYKDFDGIVASGSLIEKFTSRDIFRLDVSKTPTETTYAGVNYYDSTTLTGNYDHGFTERFWGKVNVSYNLNDYPNSTTERGKTKERKDTQWTASAALEYEMLCNTKLVAKYQYKQKRSNFDNFNYNDNIASIGLKAAF